MVVLLDGLNEVAEPYRNSCVAAISQFERDYPVRFFMTSREDVYKSLAESLNSPTIVQLQPLSLSQINSGVLHQEQFHSLRNAIAHDNILAEVAQTPLMLRMLAILFRSDQQVVISKQYVSR